MAVGGITDLHFDLLDGDRELGGHNRGKRGGVTLSATLAAPTGATSGGKLALSTTAADVVTGISTLNASGKSIGYELAARGIEGGGAGPNRGGAVPSGLRAVSALARQAGLASRR